MGLIDDLIRTKQEKNGLLASLDKAKAEQPNRPLSTTVKDIGVSVGAGVPNVLGTLADVVDMATGDSIDVVGQFGDAARGVGQQILNEGLSPETLSERQAISQTLSDENAGIGDMAMSMFKNPMGALTMGAESAATMLPVVRGAKLAVTGANAIGKIAPAVGKVLTPSRAATLGATGTNALLNAGDTFGELEGQSLADRYLGASVPLAVSMALGAGAEPMIVNRFIGASTTPVSSSIKEGLSNLGKGALKGGAKEFVSEAGEGGSQAVGEAVGKGEEINPTQVGKQAFLEGALGAAPGAVGGGLSNVKMAEPKNEPLEQIEKTVAKLVEDAQANQTQPEDVVANVLKALGGLDDKYQESKPQEEVKPEPVAEQTPVAEETQAQTEVRRIDRGILQNRKRDDKDSVNQMRKIANAPDYGRVGYSRDFANGAPVVAFGSIPEEQKGRTDYAVSVTGERIPVQYAVVDADTVSTSNDINGAENPDYGLTDRVTAIAGNGRMTALGQAYRQGSAQAYRQEMTEDTMHGVSPQVIAKMNNPVLVRIMPNERVRDDIGDMSNISSNKSLSAIEAARNDANRVDLDSLEFNEDGTPTRDSLSRFVSGMPETERGSMMDKEGRATVQAVDRLNNAIFAKAYNNDDITAMYAEATDPEAKLVVNALARLAPKMAKLEGCGELDFRNALVDAVNAIVQGKRKGLKMQDILAQQDFLADPDVALFVELFARNPRSNKDVVAILSEAADFAYNEATKSDEDMFGEVQKASRGDVMNYVRDEFNKVKEAKNGKQAKQQANVQDASGGIGASQNVDGRDAGANPQSNERAGLANAQADEGFSLTGQTEQEIIADEKAEEERQAQAEREEAEAEKQEEANNLRKEIDQRNEDYANDFTLEDDTVTGEDALRGQNALKFSRNPRTGKMDIKLSIVWHGSPHIFETFLTDHIGTGEGAQAHGWGLYFALNRKVAEGYRETLTRKAGAQIAYDGKQKAELPQDVANLLGALESFGLSPFKDIQSEIDAFVYHHKERVGISLGIAKVYEDLIRAIEANPKMSISAFQKVVPEGEKYRISYAIDAAKNAAKQAGKRTSIEDVKRQLEQSRARHYENAKPHQDLVGTIERLDVKKIDYLREGAGRLFKVEIPDEDVMLDEQKTFEKQPRKVQDAIVALLGPQKTYKPLSQEEAEDVANNLHQEIEYAAEELNAILEESGLSINVTSETLKSVVVDYLLEASRRPDDKKLYSFQEEAKDSILEKMGIGLDDEYAQRFGWSQIANVLDAAHSNLGWRDADTLSMQKDRRVGRLIYLELVDKLGGQKNASLALNELGVKGIRYEGLQDGPCAVVFDDAAIKVLNYYSKNKPEESTSGSTVEDVTASLESDKDIGEAFATLRDSGEVDVVQSIEDLPEEIRSQIDDSMQSRSAMKSVEANIKRGNKAIQKALAEKTSVHRAMYRSEVGWVDFVYGTEGKPRINAKGDRKNAYGLLHILEKRYRADGYNDDQIADLLGRIVTAIAKGTVEGEAKYGRLNIVHNGTRVTLLNSGAGNSWVLTGFDEDKSSAEGETGDAYQSTNPTPAKPTVSRQGGGATADTYVNILGQTVLTIKRSDNGDIQGLYDPRTGKAYLIADALTDETAKPVFLHELGVHSAYGKNPLKLESQMKLARNMVNNGYAQGNNIAVRVKQRLFDAGEIDSMDAPIPMEAAEECLSYLVEETASTDDRGPFRKWFDSLMNAIKQWLRNHGINVNLNEWDFVEMAKGNVVAMARESGKDMSVSYSKKGKGGSKQAPAQKPTEEAPWWKIYETKDHMGKFRFELQRPFEAAVRAIDKTDTGNRVLRAIGHLGTAIEATVHMKAAPKALRMRLRAMKAQIEQAGFDALEVQKAMSAMSPVEREMISDYIEKEMKAGVAAPQEVIAIATRMTDILDAQAQELVELGMLSKESYERYRGRYLPRKYNKPKQEQDFFGRVFGNKSHLRGVAGSHLKGRGIFETVDVSEVEEKIAEGFEVRDAEYIYEDGKVKHRQGDLEGLEANEGKVQMWRDYTKKEREDMEEIRDAGFRFAIGYMDTQKDLALGRLFKAIASNPEWASSTAREGFVRVPETKIDPESNVLKYGALAGKYVDQVVYSHMEHLDSMPNDFEKAFRQGMAFWKEAKTAMNPVSHMNNTNGNLMSAHFAGVSPWDVKTYRKAFKAFLTDNDVYREAREAGLFTGSFSREEFVQSLPEDLRMIAKQEDGGFKKFGDLLMKILTWGLRDKMRKAYEFEDALFKMAIYIKCRDSGVSPEESVDWAHQHVFVYDDLPKGARAVRDWALPFFAYTYKAVPMLANAAVHYPHRLLAPAVMMYAYAKAFYMAAAAMAAGDDDDWEKIWKNAEEIEKAFGDTLPEFMRGNSFLLTPKFMPMYINERTNLPRVLDASHLIPGGNFLDFNNQAGGISIPDPLMPGHPVVSVASAFIANKDLFTGREIVKKSDSDSEKTAKRAEYLWKQLSPAIAIENYHWDRTVNGIAATIGRPIPGDPFGRTGVSRSGEAETLSNALMRWIGLKVKDVDYQKNVKRQIDANEALVKDVKRNIGSARKDFAKGVTTREAAIQYIQDQNKKIEAIKKDSAELAKSAAKLKELTNWK